MSWLTELGREIEEARVREGYTVIGLAEKLSVSRTQLRNYELGRCAVPVNILAEIAAALNVDSFTVAGFRLIPNVPLRKPVLVGGLQLKINYEIQPDQKTGNIEIAEVKSAGDLSISAQIKIPRSA